MSEGDTEPPKGPTDGKGEGESLSKGPAVVGSSKAAPNTKHELIR